MKKPFIIGLIVLVLGAMVGLVFMIRSGSRPAARTDAPATPSGPSTTPAEISSSSTQHMDRPKIADRSGPSDAASTRRPKRVFYRDDGTEVRDYRTGDHPPVSSKPRKRTRKLGRVEPRVITSVRNELRPLVRKCSERISKDLLEDNAAMQAQIAVQIEAGQVSVREAILQVRGVDEADIEELKSCVIEPLRGMTFAADEHEDVDSHDLTFPFRLPR